MRMRFYTCVMNAQHLAEPQERVERRRIGTTTLCVEVRPLDDGQLAHLTVKADDCVDPMVLVRHAQSLARRMYPGAEARVTSALTRTFAFCWRPSAPPAAKWYALERNGKPVEAAEPSSALCSFEKRCIEDFDHPAREGSDPAAVVLGVFACAEIPPNTVFGEYSAHAVTDLDDHIHEDVLRTTLFFTRVASRGRTTDFAVDASPLANPLTMINDAKGVRGGRVNCEFAEFVRVDERGTPRLHVFVRSLDRPIEAGEEILIDYGQAFWKAWERTRAAREARLEQIAQSVVPKAVRPTKRGIKCASRYCLPGEFHVERLVQRRFSDNGVEYRVRWKGYKAKDDTWEPAKRLREDMPRWMRELERRFAAQLRDRRRASAK